MEHTSFFYLFRTIAVLLGCFIFANGTFAQIDKISSDTSILGGTSKPEKDFFDLFKKKTSTNQVDVLKEKKKNKPVFISALPAVGYSLQTGFAGIVTGNIAFYAKNVKDPKISTISASITYSEYNQIIIPLYADILSKNGKWELISDNRYISYPSNIFGLGGPTDPNKNHTINFEQIKLHQTINSM
jgi:hypothetical protein